MLGNVNKITTTYTAVNDKVDNSSTLSASEWNTISNAVATAHTKINAIIDEAGTGSGSSNDSGVVTVNDKGNTTISATKHINIEPAYVAAGGEGTYGDVQIKPGDDITLESHHRSLDKRDEITIKTSNGQDGNAKAPVKLLVIASDMTLSTKGKTVAAGSNDSSNVMNINVTTGSGKGYLKVRAQAIDLRCEDHGGIALQPKGEDNEGNENKIKFEHGGGDGLEFGTFNTEKTSLYTNEYRFKKDGVWKMATRVMEESDKADEDDATTAYKYQKNTTTTLNALETLTGATYEESDDFYDFIDVADEQATTRDIIRTANAFNGVQGMHAKITDKGNLEIESEMEFEAVESTNTATVTVSNHTRTYTETHKRIFTLDEMIAGYETSDATAVKAILEGAENGAIIAVTFTYTPGENAQAVEVTQKYKKIARNINIESCAGLKLKGVLDFGSTFNFGETDNGIEFQYKLTKKNATKDCGKLKVVGVNNHTSNSLTVNGVTIPHGETATIAETTALDVIKAANLFANTGSGISGNKIVVSENIWQATVTGLASENTGLVPPGADNWDNTAYSNIKFPNVPADAFVRYQTYSDSDIAEILGLVDLSSIPTTSDGTVLTIIVKALTSGNAWVVKFEKQSAEVSCTLTDIVRLVDYMKSNDQGPWSANAPA